jgi:NADH dehydrogenase FAD-containing subunit
MNQTQIVVLGAGYAGLRAAMELAHKSEAQVTLVNAAPVFVERVRLHQQASGQTIKQHSITDLARNTKLKFVQGYVTRIDLENHKIIADTADGEQQIHYDYMVYALGSMIDRDSVPGIREYTEVLMPDRVTALYQKLAKLPDGSRLIICGGGLTGIESSTELAEAFPQLKVTLVTAGPLGANLSEVGRKHLLQTFARLNITIQDQTRIERVEAEQIVTDKGNLAYDVALWAGSFAVPKLAQQSGLTTNALGQIVVDSYLRSVSHPEIYAAGDAASPTGTDPYLRMACATALPMGQHAAENLEARLKGQPQKPLVFKYMIQCISLGRHDGLIQMVNGDDTPREQVFTGRTAAFVKEQICRFAFKSAVKGFGKLAKILTVNQKPETAHAV